MNDKETILEGLLFMPNGKEAFYEEAKEFKLKKELCKLKNNYEFALIIGENLGLHKANKLLLKEFNYYVKIKHNLGSIALLRLIEINKTLELVIENNKKHLKELELNKK